MNSKFHSVMMAAIALGYFDQLPKREEKQSKKCLLPECNNLTLHNGGYCSSIHCLEHKKRIKNA